MGKFRALASTTGKPRLWSALASGPLHLVYHVKQNLMNQMCTNTTQIFRISAFVLVENNSVQTLLFKIIETNVTQIFILAFSCRT